MPPPPPIASSTNTLNTDVIQQQQQLCTCTMVRYQDYSFMRSRHNSYCSHASRWSYSSHLIDPLQGLRSASSCMMNNSCRNSLSARAGAPLSARELTCVSAGHPSAATTAAAAPGNTPRHRGCLNRVSSIKSQTASLRKFEVDLMSADMVDRNSLPPDYLVSL